MKNARSPNPVSPYCTGCGACVGKSNDTLRMDWDTYGFLTPRKTSTLEVPLAAIQACPFVPAQRGSDDPDEDVLARIFLPHAKNEDADIGHFESTYIGYSPKYRATSSSGGLATYLFEKILEKGIADHLFVVTEGGDGYSYRLVSKDEDINSTSKTRYFPVSLEKLFHLIGELDGKVAVSGVACFVKAIRMRQRTDLEFANKVSFVVGIICGGLKSKSFTDYLASNAGAGDNFRTPEYRVKDAASTSNDYSFSAIDQSGRRHFMKMSAVGDMWGTGMFKAKACDFCTDVLTELADVSLGDAWLPEYRQDGLGNSVIITRSRIADIIIAEGIHSGQLEVRPCPPSKVIDSQSSSFAHRRGGLKFRLFLARISLQPLPYVRKRLLKPASVSYSLVQIQREVTRSLSLSIWSRNKNAFAFNKKMRLHLRILRVLTRLHHILR